MTFAYYVVGVGCSFFSLCSNDAQVTNVMPVSDDDLERLNLEVFKKVDEAVSKQEIAA
jgi:hypothetical protein